MARKKKKQEIVIEEEEAVPPRVPQLIVGIAAYNEAETLEKCLSSVKEVADRIIVVDGRFLGANGTEPYSSDDTKGIAEQYGCEVIQISDLPQNEQRNQYLVGVEGDYYFIVDADEVLEGDLNKEEILLGKYNVYGIWIRGLPRDMKTLRLYKHIGEKPSHAVGNLLLDGSGKLMDATYPKGFMAEKFWLRHLK